MPVCLRVGLWCNAGIRLSVTTAETPTKAAQRLSAGMQCRDAQLFTPETIREGGVRCPPAPVATPLKLQAFAEQ